MDEDKYKEQLKANGVELPEEPKEETPEEEPKEPKTPAKEEKEPEDKESLQEEPKEQRRRSIYDVYKDEKKDRKQAEIDRDTYKSQAEELRQKLAKFEGASTTEEKEEAKDDLEAFAQEINADPSALKRMRELFLKDVAAPAVDPELLKDIKEFKEWRTKNSAAIEKQMFDEEWNTSLPKLDKLFPKMSEADKTAVKAELDKLSHTKEWHDKPLAFIAFENQDTLATLITPRKRGMEGKQREDVPEAIDTDFNPEADISKMSEKEYKAWKAQYDGLTKSTGLLKDANGKKIII